MEPFLITIGDVSINPHQISSATRTDDGVVRVWMLGYSTGEPLVFEGKEAESMWEKINELSKWVCWPKPR